jgi:hypothetical protein
MVYGHSSNHMPQDRGWPNKMRGCYNKAMGFGHGPMGATGPGLARRTGARAHGAWPHGPPYDHMNQGRAPFGGLRPIELY